MQYSVAVPQGVFEKRGGMLPVPVAQQNFNALTPNGLHVLSSQEVKITGLRCELASS